MKKKIFIGVFMLVILATAVCSVILAVKTYRDEIAHDDILEGLGAGMTLVAGVYFVLLESDLFCTVYYFVFRKKTVLQTVFTLLATLSAVAILVFFFVIDRNMEMRAYENAWFILAAVWPLFRTAYIAAALVSSIRRKKRECEDVPASG